MFITGNASLIKTIIECITIRQIYCSFILFKDVLSSIKDDTYCNQSGHITLQYALKTSGKRTEALENAISNVMVAGQEELDIIQNEIQLLTSQISGEAIDRKSKNLLSRSAYKEMADLQEELREEKRVRTELCRKMEMEIMSSLRPLLQNLDNGQHLSII
ncbi:hypothetical protein L1887_32380 [Cichorium endivia]|nr:hypothetical protein L1887_32380 [Cichorium endivia]